MDGFITMSQAVLADLKTLVPQKPSQYIPHPMYDNFGALLDKKTAIETLGLDVNKRYLLFFGFIRQYKGLDMLLKSFAKSGLKDKGVALIVAGEYYEDSAPYKALIKDLHLGDAVIERNDFIPNSEVSTYFSAADMVVQTYHSATQSGVTQIAYHFNKPMLVTDVGGLAETVPNGEVGYVCQKDEVEIAAALNDFYDNNREIPYSKAAEAFKKNFSWDLIMDAIENI
jgi:D-inositol-3-phosphate glycosyltransferase